MQKAFRAKISERPFFRTTSSLHQLPELLHIEIQEFFHIPADRVFRQTQHPHAAQNFVSQCAPESRLPHPLELCSCGEILIMGSYLQLGYAAQEPAFGKFGFP